MSGYTPVFDSVFEGTLCGRWPTLPVWMTILPMADKNGHIDRSLRNISLVTGWPVDLLEKAIEELMQPDPESRSEDDDGRRLALIDPENRSWGWRVVNHGKYREKARKAAYDSQRTESGKDAERKHAERSPDASREVPTRPAKSRALPPSDSDSDSDTNINPKSAGTRAIGASRSETGLKPVGTLLTQKPTLPGGVVLTPADLKRLKAAATSDKPRFPLKVPGRPDLDATVPQPAQKAPAHE